MNNDTQNTIIGVLAGTAIGAALGILFAPDKGENTRQKIATQAANTKDTIAESAIEMKNKAALTLAATGDTLEDKVNHMVSDVSHKTEDVITTLESKLAELKIKNRKLQKTA